MKTEAKTKKQYLFHSNLAGLQYYDALDVWDELKIGTRLNFKAEPSNKRDENAIEVFYKEHKLGYVPASHNHQMAVLLNAGWVHAFEMRIQSIFPEEHMNNRIEIKIAVLPV